MDIKTVVRAGTLAILVVSVGCGPSENARKEAERAAAAAAQARATTQAGEVIGARQEAQAQLDSARAAFLAKQTTIASKELKAAAAFTRTQADSATGTAKDALSNSAAELQRLATRVTKRSVKSVKTLDYAFARTQLAEAQYHHERALDAFQQAKPAAAGAELVMAADHFERALTDAGQTATEPAKQAIADARSVASKLASGAPVAQADLESALAAFEKQVQSVAATTTKLKS
jgi:hypothetical protein